MTIDIQVAAEAAVEAADVAETLIQQFLASGDWQVSEKPDNTPVTEVDVAVEKLIRERLTTALPVADFYGCLLYTSPSPRDLSTSRMPSSA